MPPTNDNWASAIALAPASGGSLAIQSNAGATNEAGEPANNGKTVWYSWTAPDASPYFFSTRGLAGQIQTVLQAFTGTSLGALTEAGYTAPSFKQRASNWDAGSFIIITPAAGATYYIRVDVLAGAGGNFPLTWGLYFDGNDGGCTGCPSSNIGGLHCVSTATINSNAISGTNLTGTHQAQVSFGAQAAGKYYIAYCGGAFHADNIAPAPPGGGTACFLENTFIYSFPPPFSVRSIIYASYYVGAVQTLTDFGLTGAGLYPTEPACQAAFRCAWLGFRHDAGDISMWWKTVPTNNLMPYRWTVDTGAPDPTFGLYRIYPSFSFVGACAKWLTAGSSAQVTITLKNNIGFDWVGADNITVSLDSVGGISGSTTVTNFAILANNTASATLNFNCATTNVFATIRLSSPYFPADVVLPAVYLGPVVNPGIQTNLNHCGTGGGTIQYCEWRPQYVGLWQVSNVNITLSHGPGGLAQNYLVNTGACSLTNSTTFGPYLHNYSGCIAGTGEMDFYTLRYFGTGEYLNFTFTDANSNACGTYSIGVTQI